MTKPAHLVLTDRDIQILMMIYSFGGCTAEHIRHRFFRTKGGRSACYARIAKLIQTEYITSIRLPSLHGVGSGRAFLTPGPKGRAVLAEILRLSRTELARVRADSPLFIQHHLALCDLRLAVELACERSEVFHLQEWMGDHELRQTPIKVTDPESKKGFSFVPDASFTLALPNGSEQTFLVEMDLSTLSPKRCREKLACYLIHAKKHPSPVLFVAPDDSRVGALSKWAAEEANKLKADPTIFWMSASHRISETTVLR
ncbi:MAG: replication-relaxation family protein [Dehalococcoidia bacterium]|nr:replication-relaxation family protein [Dehalococcoidia bacterium]